jgi:hypothetical protein
VRVVKHYSHLNGWEWLQVQRPGLWDEIVAIVGRVEASDYKTKASKEASKSGRMLYSPTALNKRLAQDLDDAGWQESRTAYWVTDDFDVIRRTVALEPQEQKSLIEEEGKRPIYSYNQTDFVKDRVALEVQFGKYAFVAYDLFVKHMAFYVGDQIDLGIELLPMKSMQEEMSSGPGYYEGALYDIARQGRATPAVPLILVGVAP